MLDIGLGEGILIVVLALLVFGPERLPKVASDAARTLRQIRSMATAARRDLVDAAGLDEQGELTGTLRDIRDLDPRRVLTPLGAEEGEAPVGPPQRAPQGGPGQGGPGQGGPGPIGGSAPSSVAGRSAEGAGSHAQEGPGAHADPDWS